MTVWQHSLNPVNLVFFYSSVYEKYLFTFLISDYKYEMTEEGFDIIGAEGRVKIRIATIPSNMSKLDPASHMPHKILDLHLSAIKHWLVSLYYVYLVTLDNNDRD